MIFPTDPDHQGFTEAREAEIARLTNRVEELEHKVLRLRIALVGFVNAATDAQKVLAADSEIADK